MSILRELNYLFDRKTKIKSIFMMLIISLGSVAELLGVAIIIPIINLAMDPAAIDTDKYCRMIAQLFDLKEAKQVLLVYIAIAILLYIVKNIYLAWMTYCINRFSKKIRMQFSIRLMESYMKQPYKYFLHKNSAEIMRSITNDTVNLYTAIANSLQTMSHGITALLIIIFLAATNIVMTLVMAVLLGGCVLIVMFGLQRKIKKLGAEFQKCSAQILQYAKQAFEGIKEVKINNREKYFVSEYKNVFHNATQIELVNNMLNSLPKYLIEAICIGGILGYLAIAILVGGDISQMLVQLSAFAVGAFKLLPSVNTLYANVTNVMYNKASIDLIYHDIKEVEDIPEENIEDQNIEKLELRQNISVKQICFHYDGTDRDVLRGVSFEIKKGESVAFIGESGGGKTTLVDLIIGILEPSEGRVEVDGVNVCGRAREWRKNIGYIPQNIFLLDDTIRKNVAYGVPEEQIDDEKIWRCLKKAQLDTFVEGLTEKLDTKVGEAGARLSGGQRQRLGIARALYREPDILVFDEATSALDTETEKEVMAAIDVLHGEKTILMIAHRLTTIENCDHVYRVGQQRIEQVR